VSGLCFERHPIRAVLGIQKTASSLSPYFLSNFLKGFSMKNVLLAVALAAFSTGISSMAYSAGSPQTDAAYKGNANAGKGKVAVCGACHGNDGNSTIAANPKLAGQGYKYLLKQMKDIQSGEREIAMMTGMLNGMSAHDLAAIAA